jgi:hypothetical protein
LDTASTDTITVEFDTSDVTASAGDDYTAQSGVVTFAPGETKKEISIEVVGDTVAEDHEEFLVTLSNPVNAVIDTAVGSGIILNDDARRLTVGGDLEIESGKGNDNLRGDNVHVAGEAEVETGDGNDRVHVCHSSADDVEIDLGRGDDTLGVGHSTATGTVEISGGANRDTFIDGTGNGGSFDPALLRLLQFEVLETDPAFCRPAPC